MTVQSVIAVATRWWSAIESEERSSGNNTAIRITRMNRRWLITVCISVLLAVLAIARLWPRGSVRARSTGQHRRIEYAHREPSAALFRTKERARTASYRQ